MRNILILRNNEVLLMNQMQESPKSPVWHQAVQGPMGMLGMKDPRGFKFDKEGTNGN